MSDDDKKLSKEDQDEQDILEQAKDDYDLAIDAFEENQRRYEDDVEFGRMGQQWEETDIASRDADGRPMLTVNRMPAFIRQVVNDARQNKPSIKVHPNDDQADPETAEVINGLIRNIEQTSKADLAYDTCIDCAASGGFGFFRIDLDYADDDTFDMDIRINRILNPLTVLPDPNSTGADSADWNKCFVTEMLPKDEFEERWPDADPINWESSYADDTESNWYSKDEIRIAEYWVREPVEKEILIMASGDIISRATYDALEDEYVAIGNTINGSRMTTSHKVTQYIMTGQEILETNPWPSKFIPIIPVYGEEVFSEGERHFFSLIHFAKDSQRMYNYWRTTTTELVALAPKAPWIGPVGAFNTDMDRWQNANVETTTFLEYDGDIPPQRQGFAGPPAGALQESLNASDDMKSVMGLHDASLGGQTNDISGVAIGKRVREGDTSTFHFVDNMARAIRHAGCIIVDLIPAVYSRERMVRVLGEDGVPQTVAINKKITKEDEMLQGEALERKEAIENVYNMTVGKYDVTVKSGPSYTTQREESRESMISLLQAFPQAAAVTGDLVVEAMDWPNADVFAKRLKSLLPQGVLDDADDPRVGQLTQQLQGMEQVINQLMADREGKQAEIQVDHQKLALEARKIDINQMDSETKRMEANVKLQEAQIKAMDAQRTPEQDNTSVVIKSMDIEAEQQQSMIDAALEEQKIQLERDKLVLEVQKLDLEREKAAAEACAKMLPDTMPMMHEMDEAEAPNPVQVFNVQAGSKTVDIQRGPNGEIIGATVNEQ